MKKIKGFDTVDIGCQGTNCIFYKGRKTREVKQLITVKKDGRKVTEKVIRVDTDPICEKGKERGAIREEIYNRAFRAKDEKKTYRTMKNAFDKIADEWRNNMCRFYQRLAPRRWQN